MRCFKIFIKLYNWTVNVLYNCDCSDNEQIINYLEDIDCPISLLKEASNNLDTCDLNIGFTYSNCSLKRSFIVISKTTDSGQFYNTIVHECYHLVSHITRNSNTTEEDRATLIGNIILLMYKKFIHVENFDLE